MDAGVRLEVLWHDADVFKARISAWNGRFGGSANTYLGIGGLAASAQKLGICRVDPLVEKRGREFTDFERFALPKADP